MNTDLFLAILSMDAYNRPGTSANTTVGLVLPTDAANGIGNASVDAPTAQSDISGDSFFAQVYQWLGSTVISYRGTDNYYADPFTGWVTGDGAYNGAQAQDAAKLYLQLNGNNATPNSDFILTGDSLGGGLAGFIADIYSDEAVIFNNMPFEKAVTFLYRYTTQGFPGGGLDTGALDLYYHNNPIPPDESKIYGYAVTGEILQFVFGLRNGQVAPVTNLDPGIVYPSQSAYQLHDIATLIVLLDARSDTTWTPVEGFMIGETYDSMLAQALRIQSGGDTGTASDYYKMQMMIAYSAIDSGTYVYGDTGMASLFQDADAFGNMERADNLGAYLKSKPVESAIAGIIDEYAGLLAINQDTNAQDESVFTYLPGTNRMVIDFTPSRWSLSSSGAPVVIVGKQTLTDAVVQFGGGKPSSFEDATAKLWNGTTNITNLSNIIKLVADTTDDPGVTLDAAADAGITGQDTATTKATDGAMLVAGGGKGDQLTGGVGNNLLVGGAGGDTLTAGTGVDLMFGGSGKDTFILGQGGTNWVDGGSGFNTAQYNTSDNLVETISVSNRYTTANADPIVMVVDSSQTTQNTGQPATDYIVSMGDIKLGSGANTVKVDSLPFFAPGGTITDLGATSTMSGDVVDFSQYPGGVNLSSSHPTAGAPNAVEVYRNKNFSQDANFGFTDFNTLILGNGDNTLALHTADDPYLKLVQAGNGKNVIKSSDIVNLTINLGTGNNIVGHVAKGTVVNLQSSDPASLVMSNDELINGSTPADEIFTPGGILIKGAVGQVGSSDPWIVGPDGTKYGFNQQGDLVIQDLLGDDTYISGYHGGPGVSFPNQTDGIFVGLSKGSAEKLLDLQRPFITYIDDIFKVGQDILYTKSGLKFFNVDPLVFDLTGQGINLTAMSTVSPMLDMLGTGFAVNTGWVEPNDGVLVLQQPGQDGTPNVTEMFGGPGADGFAASRLKEHSRRLAN